jgi:hypothetical protein
MTSKQTILLQTHTPFSIPDTIAPNKHNMPNRQSPVAIPSVRVVNTYVWIVRRPWVEYIVGYTTLTILVERLG